MVMKCPVTSRRLGLKSWTLLITVRYRTALMLYANLSRLEIAPTRLLQRAEDFIFCKGAIEMCDTLDASFFCADFICEWKQPEAMTLAELEEACAVMTACQDQAGKLRMELTGNSTIDYAFNISVVSPTHREKCWDWPGFQRVRKVLASRIVAQARQGLSKQARDSLLSFPVFLTRHLKCLNKLVQL